VLYPLAEIAYFGIGQRGLGSLHCRFAPKDLPHRHRDGPAGGRMVASHCVIGQVADGNAAGRTAGRSALPPLQHSLKEPMT